MQYPTTAPPHSAISTAPSPMYPSKYFDLKNPSALVYGFCSASSLGMSASVPRRNDNGNATRGTGSARADDLVTSCDMLHPYHGFPTRAEIFEVRAPSA